jgi:hypothetical protein
MSGDTSQAGTDNGEKDDEFSFHFCEMKSIDPKEN